MPASDKPQPRKRKSTHVKAGRSGEDRAADYLMQRGYRIITRNWRSSETRNEIDIIAEHAGDIVIVEVKTARTKSYGNPLGWVTPRKQQAIIRAARAYLAAYPLGERGCRFDVITIGPADPDGTKPLNHVVNAFVAGEE